MSGKKKTAKKPQKKKVATKPKNLLEILTKKGSTDIIKVDEKALEARRKQLKEEEEQEDKLDKAAADSEAGLIDLWVKKLLEDVDPKDVPKYVKIKPIKGGSGAFPGPTPGPITGPTEDAAWVGPDLTGQVGEVYWPSPKCKWVSARICEKWVTYYVPVPLDVFNIYLEQGSGGYWNFNWPGDNTFSHRDEVNGDGGRTGIFGYWSSSETSIGNISIWASTTLAQQTKVKGVGITFEETVPYANNYGCARGNNFLFHEDGWGTCRMYFEQLWWWFKLPGESWTSWWNSGIPYYRYWNWHKVNSRVACPKNVLGDTTYPYSVTKILPNLEYNFPADTEIKVLARVGYWIKAKGEQSNASVGYSLRVKPYLNTEVHSLQYPETFCINVADYI